MKVQKIMSRPVVTVAADTPIKEAAQLLVKHKISALPVLDAKGELVGIVSEADLLQFQMRPDPRTQATPLPLSAGTMAEVVGDVMTRHVLVVAADGEVSQAAHMMLDGDVKRLPVMRGRHVVGIVSRSDLVKVIARQDDAVENEVLSRLMEAGLGASSAVRVAEGVVTIVMDEDAHARRLAESLALEVPGVLEVRFAAAGAPRGGKPAASRVRSAS
jgi:CBS-domain-containing membrane protein